MITSPIVPFSSVATRRLTLPGRIGVTKWLAVGVAILTQVTVAHAQLNLSPDIDLFGDEIVKKLELQQQPGFGMAVIQRASPAEKKERAKVEGYAHALLFHDGRQLRGEIVALTKNEIIWRRPDVNEPLRFRRDEVRRVVLTPSASNSVPEQNMIIPGQPQPPEDKTKSGFATVKLPGGDWLHGELSSADGQTFALKLNDQTSFTVPRDSICWLHSGAQPAPAFGFGGGALDVEGWLAPGSTTQLDVKNGTLTVRGSDWIGRPVAALRRFELSFELPEDGEENTHVWLQPFGPEVNSYTTGTVRLMLGRAQFRHCIFANQMQNVNTPLPKEAAEAKGPVRYRVLYDGPGQRLIVSRNGQQLGEWKFLDEKDQAQNAQINREFYVTGICFQRQNGRDGSLRLNRLSIQPWDGQITSGDVLASEGDSFLSGDGKSRAGKLESLTDKEIVFSGEKLERKSGMFLQFAQEPTPLVPQEAMLLFGQLGEISVADLEISDGKARCRTVFAPALESSITALQTIAFPKRTVAPPKPSDTLVFKNGDEIPGSLLSAAKGEPWRWRTLSGQELTFRPDFIAGVRLSTGSGDATLPTDTATVELRNGDRLRGKVTGFKGNKVELRHSLLGQLTLDGSHLWNLYPNPRSVVYDGGQSPAAWMGRNSNNQPAVNQGPEAASDNSRWVYLDGNYILRPQASRNYSYSEGLVPPAKQLPERFELRCDATSASGDDPVLCVSFSGQETGSAQATIGYGRIQLYCFPRKARGGVISKTIPLLEKLSEPTSRRNIRVFVDSKVGTADILIDGVFIARLGQQAAERMPGLGESIRLQPYNQGDAPLILSNLWIGPWNGELPKPGNDTALAVSLANGDVATGALTDFQEGKLRVESDIGPLDLPMDKILAVEFGGAPAPKRPEARIRLADGCAFAVDAFRWDGENLAAHSEVLGDVKVPAKMISELVLAPAPARAPKIAAPKKAGQKPAADANKAAEAIDGDRPQ